MREVEAVEYEPVRMLGLDRDQRDALLSCGGDFTLAPEPGADGLWCLRTGSHIGTVVAPGLIVRIRPKLGISRLFVMLSAAAGAIRWAGGLIGLAESSTTEDVVASVFVDAIRRSLSGGLLRGYVAVEEESFVVRGRLEVVETLRRRPVSMAPLVQTPEFLDENTPENQVLATALAYLGKAVKSPGVRGRVVDCQRAFLDVVPIARGAPLPRVRRNRLNTRWWSAIELALLILHAGGLDLPSGLRSTRSFLVDMNVVFERFVHRALAEALYPLGHTLECNRTGLYLDDDQRHGLRPDLSLWVGTRCRFAGDCKYKYINEGLPRRDDIYQCLAYAAATNLPRVMLIYAGGARASRDVSVVDGRTTILVRTLDLAAPLDALSAQFSVLAAEIDRSPWLG